MRLWKGETPLLQPRLTSAKPLDSLRLLLVYENGDTRAFDVAPYANGPWYGELADATYFGRVRVSEGGTGVEWPHGQDIAPHELLELSIPVE